MNVHSASTESKGRANTSAVFYKAACRLSSVPRSRYGQCDSPYEFSCHAVALSDERGCIGCSECRDIYEQLMDVGDGFLSPGDVMHAAEAVGWGEQDYRTFMLLMAAEAVK